MQAIPDPQIIAAQLRQRTTLRPALAMVLGSGFHHLAAQLTVILDIPFAEISGFQILRVPSHSGRFLLGYLSKV
ncbi:MAG TPA: purine-nucleoside phosphorylase, partial [Candidatus Eisenbacteria bacterium]|nr:purine-nucleoside phosphorylase [Candidatus Eisenbacteria bacterium]